MGAMALLLFAGMVTVKFKSDLTSLMENLNQVTAVSLLMTSSTALANEGLFELTGRPLLTQAVSSFAENSNVSGCSLKKMKF